MTTLTSANRAQLVIQAFFWMKNALFLCSFVAAWAFRG
jgi:hypothetical protein